MARWNEMAKTKRTIAFESILIIVSHRMERRINSKTENQCSVPSKVKNILRIFMQTLRQEQQTKNGGTKHGKKIVNHDDKTLNKRHDWSARHANRLRVSCNHGYTDTLKCNWNSVKSKLVCIRLDQSKTFFFSFSVWKNRPICTNDHHPKKNEHLYIWSVFFFFSIAAALKSI